jgi:hypothetical protein
VLVRHDGRRCGSDDADGHPAGCKTNRPMIKTGRNARHSRLGCFSAPVASAAARRSACLVLVQAGRAAGWCFRDQATAAGTELLVDAGRYPPPPSLPLLLRQPAKATLSTRTSRTAVMTARCASWTASWSLSLLLCAGETTGTPNNSPQQGPQARRSLDRQVDRQPWRQQGTTAAGPGW